MAPQASRVAGTVSCTYRNVPNKHHIPLMLIYQIQRLPGSFQYTFNSSSAPPSCQPTLPFFRVASHTHLASSHLTSCSFSEDKDRLLPCSSSKLYPACISLTATSAFKAYTSPLYCFHKPLSSSGYIINYYKVLTGTEIPPASQSTRKK